jgi:predicted GNAT family N-acyltransferase
VINLNCIICKTQKEIVDNFYVRHQVFVKEFEIPLNYETDLYDTYAVLFLVYNTENKPIGAARFRVLDNLGIIERVSVLKNYRNQGIGELIMKTIESYAIDHSDVNEIHLGAQLRAFSFYKRLNYEPFGEMYFEVGIEHKKMKKRIR